MVTTKIITLKALRKRVETWDSKTFHDFASTKKMDFDLPFHLAYTQSSGNIVSGQLTPIAFGQLCGRMGIPAAWARKDALCPPPLRHYVINWKLANTLGKRLMIRQRSRGKSVIFRALLSTLYKPYDHLEFVDLLIDVLDQLGVKVEVFRPEVGDELRAYLIVKEFDFGRGSRWQEIMAGRLRGSNGGNATQNRVSRGDGGGPGGLKPAIFISNSEVGTGAVRLTAGLFRSYCSNGLILGWQAKHMLAIPHLHVRASSMGARIREAVPEVIKLSEKAAIQLLQSQTTLVNPESIAELARVFFSRNGVILNEGEKWLKSLESEVQRNKGIVSWFDVINSASRWAGALKDREQGESMERMAGAMITAKIPQSALLQAN